MKTTFVVVFFLSLSVFGSEPSEKLIDALELKESGADVNVKDGDGGLAKGILQIHELYWLDGCRFLKVDWPYEQARDRQKARKVCKAYLTVYGKLYKKETGKEPTEETYARMHNGGGKQGWKVGATLKYWKSVQKFLQPN